MGTRGFIGFVSGGQTKISYNQFDSYPSGLGTVVLVWLRRADLAEAAALASALRVVDSESRPTEEEITAFADYYDGQVDRQEDGSVTWYQLLRGLQGYPGELLAAGVIEDASYFPADSLFAEYGYVVDFDTQVFEVYTGFQTEPHARGRFAGMKLREDYAVSVGQYYPVALVASWPLAQLPDEEGFLRAMRAAEGIDEDEED